MPSNGVERRTPGGDRAEYQARAEDDAAIEGSPARRGRDATPCIESPYEYCRGAVETDESKGSNSGDDHLNQEAHHDHRLRRERERRPAGCDPLDALEHDEEHRLVSQQPNP